VTAVCGGGCSAGGSYRQYPKLGFEFFIVYTREANPGKNYPHHDRFEQKLAHAKKLRELDKVDDITILTDDIHGAAHSAYGQLRFLIHRSSR
jgi:hypothetical protein